ncbi:MAG: hypothetical protein A2128_00670 [Candidatus Liptonbacteria bacterium GWC1_60_9]|uniref:POTRA domain-containing protein n=3 Tax=Candidatus Liptoniibacteriota TaxID=1817909 RepID=A0A1G2CKY3_9BACT|nr:MAG: hypothetical protein A2128_00670 [Candidatus Liptonbacteria bacterium GWC1_60_9]OGY98482.1 MAG: hypothetical protein A3E09_01955 [Candidatus Liptonbacteria bacterium RIFCSPHIGHO2_12_FULL_60_13]OGZ02053.1 MAG: hypothetical protein A3G64_02660 [Candidatus Liptonbacteria bacterium RIFCSPLOWO2_12_FULL_60_15]
MTVSVRTIYEKKKRVRLKLKLTMLAAGLLAVLGAFSYLNWEKNLFEFKEVVLSGAGSLSREELLGGLPGQGTGPVSFFSPVRVSHPAIAGAAIHRDYFNRILRIDITERERYGVWCADACFWFDREGMLFSPAPRAEGALVRRVRDTTGRSLALGGQALPGDQLRSLVIAFDMLERARLTVEEVVLEDLSRAEATAQLLLGPRVLFSLRNDPAFAYEPLLNLAGELEKLAYIDLRTDQRIFLKYR